MERALLAKALELLHYCELERATAVSSSNTMTAIRFFRFHFYFSYSSQPAVEKR